MYCIVICIVLYLLNIKMVTYFFAKFRGLLTWNTPEIAMKSWLSLRRAKNQMGINAHALGINAHAHFFRRLKYLHMLDKRINICQNSVVIFFNALRSLISDNTRNKWEICIWWLFICTSMHIVRCHSGNNILHVNVRVRKVYNCILIKWTYI